MSENDSYDFLKVKDDYFIEYQGEIFNMRKPSDIRSLCYLLNREKGFSELECEDNEIVKHIDGITFIRCGI